MRAFTLSSDTAHPQLEQPFHVTLTIRVDEKTFNGDNVFLPTFEGAEELGDLRQVSHGANGTTYRETLTLVAHTRGTLTVSEAYLDALDARDGKPKRFLSNALALPVGGGPITSVWHVLRTVLLVVIEVLLLGAAVFVIAVMFWRRRVLRQAQHDTPGAQHDTPTPTPVILSLSKDEVEDAFDQLRAKRDRYSVLALRTALWKRAGADPGATLHDVLRRTVATEAERQLLVAVEHAAFIEDSRLNGAIEEVLCSPR